MNIVLLKKLSTVSNRLVTPFLQFGKRKIHLTSIEGGFLQMCPLLTNTFFLEQFGVIIGELLQQCCILCRLQTSLKIFSVHFRTHNPLRCWYKLGNVQVPDFATVNCVLKIQNGRQNTTTHFTCIFI